MSIKIGINGFGRIGRMTLRSIIENNRKDIEVVAINNRGSNEISSFLLKYDTIHGEFKTKVSHDDKFILVNEKKIEMSHEKDGKSRFSTFLERPRTSYFLDMSLCAILKPRPLLAPVMIITNLCSFD